MLRADGLIAVFVASVFAFSAAAQDRDAQPLNPPQPTYPFLAGLFNVEGYCDVRFAVDEEGLPFGITTNCSHPIFCSEAERAVSRVRFLPMIENGRPTVRGNIIYPLQFSFPRDSEEEERAVSEQISKQPSGPCREIPVS